ncbi:TPA: hypothetical protein N0F65_001547, partial [Lagenidium giganteum]
APRLPRWASATKAQSKTGRVAHTPHTLADECINHYDPIVHIPFRLSMTMTAPVNMPQPASPTSDGSPRAKEVAPFLKSLRKMLSEESPDILRWTTDGKAFEIHDFDAMSNYVLPKYFKHRKYASFQRQLNYFNFRKWTKSKAIVCTFSNPYFQRDHADLAWNINRKKCPSGSSKTNSNNNNNSSNAWKKATPAAAEAPAKARPQPQPRMPMPQPVLPPSSAITLEPVNMGWHHVDDHFRIMVPELHDDDMFRADADAFGDIGYKNAFDSPQSVDDVEEFPSDMNLLEWIDKAFPTLETVQVLDLQHPSHAGSMSMSATGASAPTSTSSSSTTLTSQTMAACTYMSDALKPKEVAPFLKNLRKMLDTEHPSVLCWTADGTAFEIHDMDQMMNHVLPKYFKHRKYTSFQRQLNYFNFRKWTKSKAVVCTFSNPFFLRDQPDLAWRINRKKSTPSHSSNSAKTLTSTVGSSMVRPALPIMPQSTVTAPPKFSSVAPRNSDNLWHHVDEDMLIVLPSSAGDVKSEPVGRDSFPSPTEVSSGFTTMLSTHDHGIPHRTLPYNSSTGDSQMHQHHNGAPQSFDWVDHLYPSLDMMPIKIEEHAFASFAEPFVASGGDVYHYYATAPSSSSGHL